MADDVYLDGSQPYHRHEGSRAVYHAGSCQHEIPPNSLDLAVLVHVFDADALAAHDDAIRRQALAGEGPPPLYVESEWLWAIGEPAPAGQDPGTRVLAGEDQDGVVHLYATPERIARVCFDALTRELS